MKSVWIRSIEGGGRGDDISEAMEGLLWAGRRQLQIGEEKRGRLMRLKVD